jgi:hypothetical protein
MMKITGTSVPGGRIGVSFFLHGVEIGVTENLVHNEKSTIIGVTPNLSIGKDWYAKIRTRFSGGGNLLKETRGITSNFTVQRA